MEELYTQGQVNRIFNHIATSTLLYWGKMDVITWSGGSHDGRGLHRLYSRDNLYIIGLVEELTALNFPLDVIKRVMEVHFRKPNNFSSHSDDYLVVFRGREARNLKDWGSALQPVDSPQWSVHWCVEEDIPVITNVVIRLSEVIKKVDGYISGEE